MCKVDDSPMDVVERICFCESERDDEDTDEDSEIQRYYEGSNVFITGASGFVGLVLVEKLLRCCPGINKLFLLIRSKRNKSPNQRVQEMFLDPLFETLLCEYPAAMEKVVPMNGDITEKNLGLSVEDVETLKREVDTVFHIAATVRFDEYLRTSYQINVRSTKDILQIAESMQNLRACVYVSTAYSNAHITSHVREKFYPCYLSEAELELLLNSADDYTVACLSQKIMENGMNSYLLTKSIAEEIVRKKVKDMPVAVYRPSIVLNTYKEPKRGWHCSIQGFSALMMTAGLGILRTFFLDGTKICDVVPVDKCASGLAALPWHLDRNWREKSTVPIYNHVSFRNPITWNSVLSLLQNSLTLYKLSCSSQVWAVHITCISNKFLYYLHFYVYEILPLPIFILAEKWTNSPPRLTKIYRKITQLANVLEFFTIKEWSFEDNNMMLMWSSMNTKDRHLFDLNVSNLDWAEYFKYLTRGFGYYLLGERQENIEQCRNNYRRMCRLDKTVCYSFKAFKIYMAYVLVKMLLKFCKNYIDQKINNL